MTPLLCPYCHQPLEIVQVKSQDAGIIRVLQEIYYCPACDEDKQE